MTIRMLGYIGIEATDLAPWSDLADTVLGFETVRDHAAGSPDALYLRMDSQHHRVTIYRGKRNGLRHLGWQVDDSQALDAAAAVLQRVHIEASVGSAAAAAERGVRRLISFRDTQGFAHEIYCGPIFEQKAFVPARPTDGFVTAEQGMGHVVLCAADPVALATFFQEQFGFRLSDTITLEGVDIIFLRCNRRHHTLAIMQPGLGVEAGTMHHVLFEMRNLDDVGRAYDLVLEKRVPLMLTLGRHVNDRMVSFYFQSPSAVGIEIGAAALTVDDEASWRPVHYNHAGLWGHKLVV